MKRFTLLLLSLALAADDKKPQAGRTANDNVGVEAIAHTTKEDVKSAVGYELDQGFIVVDITMTPKNGQTVKISRDDFVLISQKDGQRCTPYAPTQIAGSAGLVISSRPGSGGTMAQERRRPWGGLGGGPIGGGLPTGGGSVGSTTANTSEATATAKEGEDNKPNPLLETLKQKILPEKEISEPLSGQLYFLLEGKHKLKDLELFYKAPGGRLSLKFVR